MVDHLALLDAVDLYADALLNSYDIGAVLFRLTDQVVSVLEVDGAGVCLSEEGGQLRPVAATGRDIAALQGYLTDHDDGPAQHAWQSGDQVTMHDVVADARWPDFARVALEHECRAVAALPMPVDATRVGALEMVRHDVHRWSETELRVAQVLANMASGYILNNANLEDSRTLASQLQHALESRVVIEQAKGVMAERAGISPGEAFERLRGYARDQQLRIHDVASDLLDGTLDLSSQQ